MCIRDRVIAELALVLAAVGALAQIPGLQWLINEGGNLLQGVGTAIGKFIGGIEMCIRDRTPSLKTITMTILKEELIL